MPIGLDGSITLKVENLISHVIRTETFGKIYGQEEKLKRMETSIKIPDKENGLFKIILYGQETADWRYLPVRLIPVLNRKF